MSAANSKPAMSASDWIRSMPFDWSPKKVWEEAQKEGIKFSKNLVHTVRFADRKRGGPGARSRMQPAKSSQPTTSAKSPKTKTKPQQNQSALMHAYLWAHQQKHGHGPSVDQMLTDLAQPPFQGSRLKIRDAVRYLAYQGVVEMEPRNYESLKVLKAPGGSAPPKQLNGAALPALPPASTQANASLIQALEAAARQALGAKALAGESDVAEAAAAFKRVIELLSK